MRYNSLDFYRGLCLALMTIGHFGNLSILKNLGFVSAAEGFVFISGIVSGIAFSKMKKNKSMSVLQQQTRKRSIQIYIYHLATLLTLCLVVLSSIPFMLTFYSNTAPLFTDDLVSAFVLNATFLYKTYHLDILPMYVIFILLIPLSLKVIDKFGTRTLLLLSGFFWAINHFGFTQHIFFMLSQYIPVKLGEFQTLSWQFLFIIGFYIGNKQYKNKLNIDFRNAKYLTICLFVLGMGFILRWSFSIFEVPAAVSRLLFNKNTLGIFRILNFMALAYFAGYIFQRVEILKRSSFLPLIGRHSLHVYTFQTILLFTIIPFYKHYIIAGFLKDILSNKVIWKLISIALTLPLLYIVAIPAYYRERRKGDLN